MHACRFDKQVICDYGHDICLPFPLQALGHGLSFPLSEIEILRDCVNVYCEWLSALLPNPKCSVPAPILADPNHYARIIINHFYYLFVPRGAQGWYMAVFMYFIIRYR